MSRNFNGIIKSAHITKFRKISNLSINLGSHVTIIAGQNSTMKTTLLGMLGQPFSMRRKTFPMYGARTIEGAQFEGKLKDKFKFSEKHDIPGEHVWRLDFVDESIYEEGYIEVKSELRPDGTFRFWTTKGREEGDGFAQLPVIFLSLKRLLPIGESGKIKVKEDTLNEDEKAFFATYHNSILGLQDNIISPQYLSSTSKKSLGPETEYYDAQTISSGQDNIGKILLSVLSFKRLKEKYGDDYKGGLLLIDELDATLFPAAQKKLIEALFSFAASYSIQIIATSHSYSVIENLFSSKYKHSGKLIYLRNKEDSIMCEKDVTLKQIDSDLNIKPLHQVSPKKIRVYTEDAEAIEFAKNLLGSRYTKLLQFVNVKIGCKELITLSTKRKIPEFSNSLIILDGDERNSAKNIISLPGGNDKLPPDQLIYQFLSRLPENDDFWPGYNEMGLYTKQACFLNYNGLDFAEVAVREKFKKWYIEQKEFWGKGSSKVYSRWKKDNTEEAKAFIKEFQKAYNYLAKKHELPQL